MYVVPTYRYLSNARYLPTLPASSYSSVDHDLFRELVDDGIVGESQNHVWYAWTIRR